MPEYVNRLREYAYGGGPGGQVRPEALAKKFAEFLHGRNLTLLESLLSIAERAGD